MGNEYSVKSLQWYAKAQEFNEMMNSRGLKNKIIFMTHENDLLQRGLKNKIIFMTHENDLLQMRLLVCAASNNLHENSHQLLILRALYLT